MNAKHTVFCDKLSGYFLEFDIYDREQGFYLDTPSRQRLTRQMPVVSVPVLAEGRFDDREEILKFLGESGFISADHMAVLRKIAEKLGVDPDRQYRETDSAGLMEGLYLKVEKGRGKVPAEICVSLFHADRGSFADALSGAADHLKSAVGTDRPRTFLDRTWSRRYIGFHGIEGDHVFFGEIPPGAAAHPGT